MKSLCLLMDTFSLVPLHIYKQKLIFITIFTIIFPISSFRFQWSSRVERTLSPDDGSLSKMHEKMYLKHYQSCSKCSLCVLDFLKANIDEGCLFVASLMIMQKSQAWGRAVNGFIGPSGLAMAPELLLIRWLKIVALLFPHAPFRLRALSPVSRVLTWEWVYM